MNRSQAAELGRRFGRPQQWRTTVRLNDHDQGVLRLGGAGRRHDVTFAVLDAGLVAVVRPVRFPPGLWRIPSGGVRPGEPVEAGVRREAGEELGIDVALTGYPLVARARLVHPDGRHLAWTTHVVTARPVSGTALAPRDLTEIAQAAWLGFGELTGPVGELLRQGPGGLRRYRADLHDRIARLLGAATARTLEE